LLFLPGHPEIELNSAQTARSNRENPLWTELLPNLKV